MITYRIEVTAPQRHLFRVTLRIAEPAAEQRLSLPVWVPGSYLVREFARHLSGLAAVQCAKLVPLTQIDKATWVAHGLVQEPLEVTYEVYAFDPSVRAAFLDAERGFFNGTCVCLRVEGREDEAHALELQALPADWQVATALPALQVDAAGRGTYQAASYDELVDHPVELGRFWRGDFAAGGVPHAFVVAGALPDFDGERLLADARRICEAQIGLWHPAAAPEPGVPSAVSGASGRSGPGGAGAAGITGTASAGDVSNGRAASLGRPPFDRYLFLLNAVEEGHGGLEHRTSSALIAPRRDLPRRKATQAATHATNGAANGATNDAKHEISDGYLGVLGVVSHEYFHAWNVKRLRPREFARYDYTRENYTGLLWFFEGFTSYYDDLLVLRSGLIDASRYLKLVAKTVGNVLAAPGRHMQSVAESSFDAWIKYYRADENTPNSTVSYYAKGSLIALAFDLTLRSAGGATLDDVMRELWRTSGAGPIDEADIAAALERVGGRSFGAELAAWVHGTEDLPLQALLARFGVEWTPQPATLAQRLGVRVSESALTGIKVSHVLRDGAAEQAGLAAGDEILALGDWRLRRLDDALRLLQPGASASLLVVRDQRVLRLALNLPCDAVGSAGSVTLGLAAQPAEPVLALRRAWLGG